MDARRRRSRAQLALAILALAGARDASELTVSEVATAASVHRSTFYEHASSPVDLLHSVLREELDAVRVEHLGPHAAIDAASVTATTRGVLDHVERHAAIYRRGLGAGSGEASLHALLASHFRESIDLLARQDALQLPSSLPEGDAVREGIANYVAEGAVGLISVWIGLPEPRDPSWFMGLYARLVPEWWPILDAG